MTWSVEIEVLTLAKSLAHRQRLEKIKSNLTHILLEMDLFKELGRRVHFE